MNILELSPDQRKMRKSKIDRFTAMEHKPVVFFSRKGKEVAREKTKAKWFDKYTRENVTATEALIRATLVMVIPVFSAIDWDCGVHTMIYIAPIIFYSEVTVFTMTCPIKSLFSNYTTVRTNNIQKRPVKS